MFIFSFCVLRYKLLLKDLLDHTDPDYSDYSSINGT